MNVVLTKGGADWIIDAMKSSPVGDIAYHAFGDSVTPAASSDSSMPSQQENRDTGTTTESSTTSHAFKSVATHTFAASFTITEYGLWSADTSGTLVIHASNESAVIVTNGDKIESTYIFGIVAGAGS